MADESNKTNNTKMVAIWSAFDGWNGLVPGVSQLSDAIAKFGNYHRELKFTNGITYEFAQGAVQVVLINDKATIYKIRVLSTFLNKELMPTNIDEVLQIYGPLIKMNVDELTNVTYERSGLRVLCSLFDNPQIVKWLEFYADN